MNGVEISAQLYPDIVHASLDSRTAVDTLVERDSIPGGYRYKGMLVYVQEVGKHYEFNFTGSDSVAEYESNSNWHEYTNHIHLNSIDLNSIGHDGQGNPTWAGKAWPTNGSGSGTGTNGTNGTNGIDGNTILHGLGSPIAANAQGRAGDFYLDTVNSVLYGPKVGLSWTGVIGTSLIGATGAKGIDGIIGSNGQDGKDGQNGTVLLYGAGTPVATNAQGLAGDFYIDTVNHFLYGPKVSTNWIGVTGTNLVGAKGADGTNGKDGKDGITPVKGVDYFDGQKGADGVNGKDGVNGVDGQNGVNGKDGYTPVKGIDYTDGQNGVNGTNGVNGNTVLHGAGTPVVTSAIGVVGDFYIDTVAKTIYGPKTSSNWTGIVATPMVGTNGTNGVAGADGNTILHGTGTPIATSAGGKIGDYYIDQTTSYFYGPKVGSTWVGIGYIALAGTNGTNGNTILNGAGSPTATSAAGKIGDFYLDTSNSMLYGPKIGATWVGVSGTSLVGAKGADGVTGGGTGTAAAYSSKVSCGISAAGTGLPSCYANVFSTAVITQSSVAITKKHGGSQATDVIISSDLSTNVISVSIYMDAIDMAQATGGISIDLGQGHGTGDNSSYGSLFCPQFQVFANDGSSYANKPTIYGNLATNSHTLTLTGFTQNSQPVWINLVF